jgi:hypothetical protein
MGVTALLRQPVTRYERVRILPAAWIKNIDFHLVNVQLAAIHSPPPSIAHPPPHGRPDPLRTWPHKRRQLVRRIYTALALGGRITAHQGQSGPITSQEHAGFLSEDVVGASRLPVLVVLAVFGCEEGRLCCVMISS